MPVPIDEPPVKVVYQFIVPPDAVAPKVTVPAPVLDPGVVLVISVVYTEACTAVLDELTQPLLFAST